MKSNWKIKEKRSDDLIDQLLINREIDLSERETFLNPDWDRDTYDPMQFTRMQEAVERVFFALREGQKITIHGDYDADGVCGSAVLFTTLKELQEKMNVDGVVEAYLPDREKDGYGVAVHTVERLVEEGTGLLITVDCGIANAESFDVAHAQGVDVIVCDHHQMAEHIPEKAILIHPLVPGEAYPNKKLCGTGVAFKLASALLTHGRNEGLDIPVGHEKWLMDLVAIATVTDVMPLLGENRALESFGLKALNKTRRVGLKKIIDVSRSELGKIDTTTIGFRIGPRINAAGRIASAKLAFDALVAKTDAEADKAALELEMLNRKRQQLTQGAYEEARRMVREMEDRFVNVVLSETWAPGIVGLIAGKLVSEFGVPAFALTRVGEQFVGSGRSIGGLHLVEAMRSCGDIFVKAGGHPQACGLTIATMQQVEVFKDGVNAFGQSYFEGELQEPELHIDMELPLETVDWGEHELLDKLQPFGEGNPEPLFVAKRLQVVSADAVGSKGSHLRMSVNPEGGRLWKTIGFGLGDWASKLQMGDLIHIVYKLSVNEWNGSRELQAEVVDLDLAT